MINTERAHVLQEINNLLANHGFETSDIYDRSCFDMVARKKLLLLLLKVLINIDSINGLQADSIKKVSRTFLGSPLIVGLKSKTEYLEEDVVYERHGIPVIALETLKNMIIEGYYPEVFADRGGYYVQINGEALKDLRQEYNLSLKDLADLAHVSRETIYKYEHGLVRACPETAMILQDILDLKITISIDLFKVPEQEFNTDSLEKGKDSEAKLLLNLGFGVIPTQKTPFDALTTIKKANISNNPLITNLDKKRNQKTLNKMAVNLKDLSIVTGSDSVFIMDRKKTFESLDGIPVVNNWEIEEMEAPGELIKLIRERKECS